MMHVANARVAGWLPRWFPIEQHPFVVFERQIASRLNRECTLLDAGCGHGAELACRFAAQVKQAFGVDQVQFDSELESVGVHLIAGELSKLPLDDCSMDVVIARAVMEHLPNPLYVYREIQRVLRPGGRFLFLTPNSWHYATVAAKMIPNRYHATIVKRIENRPEHDTFDTYYRSNSARTVRRLAEKSGLQVESIDYAGQYPSYLCFNSLAFILGSCFEKTVERIHGLRFLRRWLLVELSKP